MSAQVDEFRDTEIGQIPADWHVVSLGQVANCKGGYTFPPKYQGKHEGQHPFYKVSDMNSLGNETVMHIANNYISNSDLTERKMRLFRPGTVIFPKIGGAVLTNKKRILGCPALFDNNVMGVWVDKQETCTDDFLFYLFSKTNLAHLANIGTLPSITNTRVKSYKVPLPPLPEQRRIAAVLNAIQETIAAQEDVIAAARQLKRSLMQRLFTYGPYREPAATRETKIGEIPAHWEVTPFIDFCVLQRGFDITKKQQIPGNVPVVSSGGVRSYHNESKVSGPGVVVGRKGSLGTVHYVESDYWPHDTTLWVKDFKGNDPRFTAYFLDVLRLKRFDTGAANPTLNRNIVHAEVIGYPMVLEQKRIAEILTTIDAKVAAEEDRRTALQALFKSMLHQLMTGRIRLLNDEGLGMV